jgi:hypothetical protein
MQAIPKEAHLVANSNGLPGVAILEVQVQLSASCQLFV